MLDDKAEMLSSGSEQTEKMIDRSNKQLEYRRTHVELKLEYFVIYCAMQWHYHLESDLELVLYFLWWFYDAPFCVEA